MPSTVLAGTPPLLTLLSSTSTPPLSPLFTAHTDPAHPSQSIIEVRPDPQRSFTGLPKSDIRGPLYHEVIHIQSPDLKGTYIQAGCTVSQHRRRLQSDKGKAREVEPLGIEAPWAGFHICPLGRRDFSLELGVVDSRGKEGVIRISTFKASPANPGGHTVAKQQKTPSSHVDRATPLIHLPLGLPPKSASTLTPWLHIAFDLNTLIPLFQALPRAQAQQRSEDRPAKRQRVHVGEVPAGRLSFVSYVRVYANCRIRRIWFAEDGEHTLRGMDRAGQEEWALYAAETAP